MRGETIEIPLRRREGSLAAVALIDVADYEFLMQWTWRLSDGYARRSGWQDGKYRKIYMHRQLLGLEPGDRRQGDHKNRDRLDNRRENLRIAERAEKDNGQNCPSQAGSTSQYRGVSWHKRDQKWRAYAKGSHGGRTRHLGYFDDEQEAAAVAAAFRAEYMPFSEDALITNQVS